MKKAEQIKQMNDIELASEINNLMAEMCKQYCRGCEKTKYRCDEAVKKYLRSEVE
ncbi:hypothetical protein GH810_14350 [Acetobacterium paludosum]|uniref:Uncharacterized protein n=1 Tax=Acetobacterium paludosum TaxID=52693 RepID=A0A923HVW5_9FIRM|nr:hypothetical protein [Acetobacterium paludosum]MBC3889493.1 hypothetical protein [Acetobacterium paludosum]